MFYLRAFKNVLRYIWRFITSPIRFWWWCLDIQRSNIIAVPVLIGTFIGGVWVVVSVMIWITSDHTPAPVHTPPVHAQASAGEKQQGGQSPNLADSLQSIVSECESKGGTYAFIVKKGDAYSSWACISATRIELELEHKEK